MRAIAATLLTLAVLALGACRSAETREVESAALPEIRYFMVADT